MVKCWSESRTNGSVPLSIRWVLYIYNNVFSLEVNTQLIILWTCYSCYCRYYYWAWESHLNISIIFFLIFVIMYSGIICIFSCIYAIFSATSIFWTRFSIRALSLARLSLPHTAATTFLELTRALSVKTFVTLLCKNLSCEPNNFFYNKGASVSLYLPRHVSFKYAYSDITLASSINKLFMFHNNPVSSQQ